MSYYYLTYPFLIIILYLTSTWAQNFYEISSKNYFIALLIFLSTFLSIFLGISYTIENIPLGALLTTLMFFLMLSMKYFYVAQFSKYKRSTPKYRTIFFIEIFIVAILICYTGFYLLNNLNLSGFSKIIFHISAFINLILFIDIINKIVNKNKIKIVTDTIVPDIIVPDENLPNEVQNELPDIYHIVLDAHAGFEKEEYCDYEFMENLKQRGFNIYDKFKSNYNRTILSLSSLFNLSYIDNFIPKTQDNLYPPNLVFPFYKNNLVFTILEKLHYKIKLVINHYHRNVFKTKTKTNLISKNQFLIITFFSFYQNNKHKTKLNYENNVIKLFTEFENLHIDKNDKNYHYFHIIAPHFPFFCDENGNFLSEDNHLNFDYYFTYQKHINKKTIKLIDKIKAKMKKNSIIIIHGDHGLHHLSCPWNILMAIYTPDGERLSFNENSSSLVNLYRIIFDKYFNSDYPMLEPEYYYTDSADFFLHKSEQPYKKEQKIIPNTELIKETISNNLKRLNFDKQLEKLNKKYKNKRIVLYGAGQFFEVIKTNYDLSNLNIIGISDIKFNELSKDETSGYLMIPPDKISEQKPDIVLLTVEKDHVAERFFIKTLFKNSKKFKYENILKIPIQEQLFEEWQKQFI